MLTSDELLLTSQVTLILAAANYGLPNGEAFGHEAKVATRWTGLRYWHRIWHRIWQRPWLRYWLYQLGRSLSISLGCAALAGWQHSLLLAGALFGLNLVVACARAMTPLHFRAEVEVLTASMLPVSCWLLVKHAALGTTWTLAALPLTPARRAAYLFSAAILIFVLRGGTWIVRGILERGGSMPPPIVLRPGDDPTIQAETPRIQLNHGRMIGDIERIILTLFIANGQFAAIAFFFAGKALIRSKELEVRAWADYLLLGSLSSFLVALVAGLVMGRLMQW